MGMSLNPLPGQQDPQFSRPLSIDLPTETVDFPFRMNPIWEPPVRIRPIERLAGSGPATSTNWWCQPGLAPLADHDAVYGRLADPEARGDLGPADAIGLKADDLIDRTAGVRLPASSEVGRHQATLFVGC